MVASIHNRAEIHRLIGVIKSTCWSYVPSGHARRGNSRVENSPGRTGKCGDYFWYDPFLYCIVDDSIDQERARGNRPQPVYYTSILLLIANKAHAEAISNANKSLPSDTGSCEVLLVADVTETVFRVAFNILT